MTVVVVCALFVVGVAAVGGGLGRVAGAAPPGATAGMTRTLGGTVVGAVVTGMWAATVVVDRVEAVGRNRRMIFFVGAAVDVGDVSVVGDEVATPARVECEPPHATVNAINAPTTACLRKRRQARTNTVSSVTRYRSQHTRCHTTRFLPGKRAPVGSGKLTTSERRGM
ncbi:MAG: hypothetical protein QOJ71_2977 [Actinomycetota bacterium]|nr:hypothetical protein [Actinomycetota bacterium]